MKGKPESAVFFPNLLYMMFTVDVNACTSCQHFPEVTNRPRLNLLKRRRGVLEPEGGSSSAAEMLVRGLSFPWLPAPLSSRISESLAAYWNIRDWDRDEHDTCTCIIPRTNHIGFSFQRSHACYHISARPATKQPTTLITIMIIILNCIVHKNAP